MLLGHSMGGWIAQLYAAVFPQQVRPRGRENKRSRGRRKGRRGRIEMEAGAG